MNQWQRPQMLPRFHLLSQYILLIFPNPKSNFPISAASFSVRAATGRSSGNIFVNERQSRQVQSHQQHCRNPLRKHPPLLLPRPCHHARPQVLTGPPRPRRSIPSPNIFSTSSSSLIFQPPYRQQFPQPFNSVAVPACRRVHGYLQYMPDLRKRLSAPTSSNESPPADPAEKLWLTAARSSRCHSSSPFGRFILGIYAFQKPLANIPA